LDLRTVITQHRYVALSSGGRDTENAITKWNIEIPIGGGKANGTRLIKCVYMILVEMCGGIMGGRCLGTIIKMSTRAPKIHIEDRSVRDGITREKMAKVAINQMG
jgi:hypothetical protein